MADAPAGFPQPGPNLRTTFAPWKADKAIYRIHRSTYRSAQFNSTGKGDARFSPIRAATEDWIPTFYGGETFDCAAMETVFHDVPFVSGLKTYDKSKLEDQCLSIIRPKRELKLVDLTGPALRKLGISRRHLIDSEASEYSNTRPWAEAIHAQCAEAEGLIWVSRQHDTAKALVVFGDRMPEAEFDVVQTPEVIVSNDTLYGQLLALAQRLDVYILA